MMSTSARKRWRSLGNLSLRMTLMATTSPRSRCRARFTSAYVPLPSTVSISYTRFTCPRPASAPRQGEMQSGAEHEAVSVRRREGCERRRCLALEETEETHRWCDQHTSDHTPQAKLSKAPARIPPASPRRGEFGRRTKRGELADLADLASAKWRAAAGWSGKAHAGGRTPLLRRARCRARPTPTRRCLLPHGADLASVDAAAFLPRIAPGERAPHALLPGGDVLLCGGRLVDLRHPRPAPDARLGEPGPCPRAQTALSPRPPRVA
jgi:hypothetical protein